MIGLAGYNLVQKSTGVPEATNQTAPPMQTPSVEPQATIPLPPQSEVLPSVPTTSLQPASEPVASPSINIPETPPVPKPEPPLPEVPENAIKSAPPSEEPDGASLSELETRFAPSNPKKDDSFYNNSLVRIYRDKHPGDPMTNRELIVAMGDHYKVRGTFLAYAEKFPDWAKHYHMIKNEAAEK